ncbi:Heavy metal RND efflux outer membrane protein, CzcC family [Marinobacter nitratireducens]|uniref:Heavy metal RND efflux outer membrane protein, CzcC family n=1 Tax=Marinobacter nitratireducens TaxID=1137280 RepID=A0A072N3G9_9GAMM|nr:Heavy metal RND efflux outer membrane protein, CzcC family [Marinobacter nitratireducens]
MPHKISASEKNGGDMSLIPLAQITNAMILSALLALSLPTWARPTLDLRKAVEEAVKNDPWLQKSTLFQQAFIDESVAGGTLPDPRVTLGAANLPVDTLDFGQEGMTQATIGVTQTFPRGESRRLSSAANSSRAAVEAFRRQDRRARVKETVTLLWLELWESQQSIQLIDENRGLFEQLADVAEAGYAAATSGSRQQDVIRASLEITRLEDRVTRLEQTRASRQEALAEWIPPVQAMLPVTSDVPESLLSPLAGETQKTSPAALVHHPAVRATDQLIDTQAIKVDLARQAYQPEWSVFARYGYRDRTPGGEARSDLFSVGIGFDVPLFTGPRQDRQVGASLARLEAAKTDRSLQIRRLRANARSSLSVIAHLDERIALYRDDLLPRMEEQASAALTSYDNDAGDFAEAVRARIAELNARIELIEMQAERARQVAAFNYLTASSDDIPTY